MPQYEAWEKEYKNPILVTKGEEPQKDILRFLKFLKKKEKIALKGFNVLDLGAGVGRNSIYFAAFGSNVVGLEISDSAIKISCERAKGKNLQVEFLKHDIGTKYPFEDEYFDLILDITSSNSLNDKERKIYLTEVNRVLKKGGYFFVRALCKDGDKNAQNLLKTNPGKDPDTYIMKDLSLQEKVFSKKSFVELYARYFKILKLIKKTNYPRVGSRIYKRSYWLGYMGK